MADGILLSGPVRTWTLDPTNTHFRRYIVVSLSYAEASLVIRARKYTAKTGDGEQREIVPSHERSLRQEMENHVFTPCAVSAGLRSHHQKSLRVMNGVASIQVPYSSPLAQTDGNHRFTAIATIRKKAVEDNNTALVELVDRLPIEVMVMLDGEPKRDFLNHQKGRPVDATHLFALKVEEKMIAKKEYSAVALAMDVARCLNSHKDSPYVKQIRFDSTGMYPLPVTTLCARGASDLSTSLVGLAKVGLAMPQGTTAEKLALLVIDTVKALREHAPGLLVEGMPLTPPPDGNRGSATCLIGLGVCLAYRSLVEGWSLPGEKQLVQVVVAAVETLSGPLTKGFSGPQKRELIGEFAGNYFHDLQEPVHEGVPTALLRLLSCSSYHVSPLPRSRKPKTNPGE